MTGVAVTAVAQFMSSTGSSNFLLISTPGEFHKETTERGGFKK
jgi:hypothetical protein